MKIIEKYSDSNFIDNAEVRMQQFQASVYNISTQVIKFVQLKLQPGKTVILFSGSWRFDFDATYLEASFFKNSSMPLNDNTYFVDPNNEEFDKIIYDIAAANVLILHSALFCNYQSMDTIIDQMKSYQRFRPRQILLSVPHQRVHFNKLKYTATDVAQQYQAEIVDDSFVIQLCTDVEIA